MFNDRFSGFEAAKRDEHLRAKPPPVGSVHFDEQLLRKLFQKMERRRFDQIKTHFIHFLIHLTLYIYINYI